MTDLDTLLTTAHQTLSQTEVRDWILVLLTPVFFVTVLLEWWRMRRATGPDGRPVYELRDSLDSMTLGGIYTVLDVMLVVAFVLPAMNWAYEHRLLTIEVTAWTFVALYLGVEFCYYWFHRASHRIR